MIGHMTIPETVSFQSAQVFDGVIFILFLNFKEIKSLDYLGKNCTGRDNLSIKITQY